METKNNERCFLRGLHRGVPRQVVSQLPVVSCKGVCEKKIWSMQLKNLCYKDSLPGNDYWKKAEKLSTCCSDLQNVEISDDIIFKCSRSRDQYIESPIKAPSVVTHARDSIFNWWWSRARFQNMFFKPEITNICISFEQSKFATKTQLPSL